MPRKYLEKDKIEGMLIGSAIGDAAGGPVEFVIRPFAASGPTRMKPSRQKQKKDWLPSSG